MAKQLFVLSNVSDNTGVPILEQRNGTHAQEANLSSSVPQNSIVPSGTILHVRIPWLRLDCQSLLIKDLNRTQQNHISIPVRLRQ